MYANYAWNQIVSILMMTGFIAAVISAVRFVSARLRKKNTGTAM